MVDAGAIATVVTRIIAFVAIVVTAGSVTFYWAIVRRWQRVEFGEPDGWSELAARVGAWAAASLALVAPARLHLQARALVDAGDPVMPMMSNVLETTWGRAWALQTLVAVATLGAFVLARRGRREAWWLALPTTLALTLTPALMGHAVAAERYLALSLIADWAHVTSAGAWIGTLTLIALACHSLREDEAGGAMSAHLIDRFHPIALGSATTIVGTGVTTLFLRVDHLIDLIHSAYGAILFVKLALTLCVAGLGAYHARRGAGAARARGPGAVVHSLVSEAAVAMLVLVATGILVGTAPPMAE